MLKSVNDVVLFTVPPPVPIFLDVEFLPAYCVVYRVISPNCGLNTLRVIVPSVNDLAAKPLTADELSVVPKVPPL
jgi:hypothetical protein